MGGGERRGGMGGVRKRGGRGCDGMGFVFCFFADVSRKKNGSDGISIVASFRVPK
jgi:hypothetical protein